MNPENPTTEQIAKHYSAAMDSVSLINDIKAAKHDAEMPAQEKTDALERNAAHLELMLAKPWWTTEDLKPLRDAVAAARA
jgi:hypothetical protein